jgi:hypothetical protein
MAGQRHARRAAGVFREQVGELASGLPRGGVFGAIGMAGGIGLRRCQRGPYGDDSAGR